MLKVRRKPQQANKSFLSGIIILGVAVIGIVVLFTAVAYRMSREQQHTVQRDQFEFLLGASFIGEDISIYLNDSVIWNEAVAKDTCITVYRYAAENALFVVDNQTDEMRFAQIDKPRGKFRLSISDDGLELTPTE